MNSIRQIQELNKQELENNVSPEASWHTDYRDTAYVYIGGLPFELSEGDVIAIFSQFGEPTYINLVRDKETGKPRGFAFLKYEDQRSTDLAVDNLGGAVIMGRTLKVDHTRYKKKDDEEDTGINVLQVPKQVEEEDSRRKRRRTSESESESESEKERPMIREEIELAKLIQEHDEDDPMKPYLIREKREEVALALARVTKGGKVSKHRHHHHKSRRSRHEGEDKDGPRRKEGHRRRSRPRERKRSEDRDALKPRRSDSEDERADERGARRPSHTRDILGRDRHDRSRAWSRSREVDRPGSIQRSSR